MPDESGRMPAVPWHEPSSLLDDAGSWENRTDGTQRYVSVADCQTRGVEDDQASELAPESPES